jgi:hypothetical protein
MSVTPADAFRPNDTKKVWRYISVVPDHKPDHYICIQELDGDWGEPGVDGHDEDGWRDAEVPVATRVIRARMDETGALRNAHGGGSNRY